jgi:prophage regulatory protein
MHTVMTVAPDYSDRAPPRLLRLPEVLSRTSCSRSALYQRIAEGSFPRPTRLGGSSCRSVAWLESEVAAWIQARVADRDAVAANEQEG